jgi:hypothetical protein
VFNTQKKFEIRYDPITLMKKDLLFRCTIFTEAVRRVIPIVLFFTFCWASSGNMAEAQQASVSQAKPSSAPTPIPVIKVASEAESAMEPLREIAASLASDQTTATVADGLSRLTSEIEARIVEDIGLLRSNPPLQMLYRLKLAWQNFGDKVAAWNSELARSGTSLDEELARLDELDKIWQLTLQSVKQVGTPPEVLQRVQAVIVSIGGTRQAVDTRRAQVLTLQNVHSLQPCPGITSEAPSRADLRAVRYSQTSLNCLRCMPICDPYGFHQEAQRGKSLDRILSRHQSPSALPLNRDTR